MRPDASAKDFPQVEEIKCFGPPPFITAIAVPLRGNTGNRFEALPPPPKKSFFLIRVS